MRRWLFNIFAVVSMALCAAVAGLWVRSYFCYDGLYLAKVTGPEERPERRFFHFRSSLGSMSFCSEYQNCVREFMHPYDRKLIGAGWIRAVQVESPPTSINVGGGWLGFQSKFQSDVHKAQTRYERVVILPHWFCAIVLTAPGVLWLRSWRRRRLLRLRGHCRSCGYNLTGNVSGICPECGTAIPRITATKERQVSA